VNTIEELVGTLKRLREGFDQRSKKLRDSGLPIEAQAAFWLLGINSPRREDLDKVNRLWLSGRAEEAVDLIGGFEDNAVE
jgi:hypothetical protein